MIYRATDMAIVTQIANNESVKPTFGHVDGPIDLTPLAADPDNYVVLTDGKAVAGILEWSAPNVWQAHTMALPHVRGCMAFAAFREMLRMMFDDYQAFAIWGQTPVTNRGAIMLNRRMGCESRGFFDRAHDGQCELFWLTRDKLR